MKKLQHYLAITALVGGVMATSACSNRDGAGGTTDGNSANAYELRSKENLAPPMDTTATGTETNTAQGDSAQGGE